MTSGVRQDDRRDPRRTGPQCRTEVVAHCTVIHVSGEVDLATVHVLKEALDSAIAAPHPILLDFGETRYIDTTGIQALLRARERHHTTLAVAALAPALKRVFDILEVGRVIPMYKTLTMALATLCPPSVPSGVPRP